MVQAPLFVIPCVDRIYVTLSGSWTWPRLPAEDSTDCPHAMPGAASGFTHAESPQYRDGPDTKSFVVSIVVARCGLGGIGDHAALNLLETVRFLADVRNHRGLRRPAA